MTSFDFSALLSPLNYDFLHKQTSAWLLAALEDSSRWEGDKQARPAGIALARRLSAVIYAHAVGANGARQESRLVARLAQCGERSLLLLNAVKLNSSWTHL